MAMVARRARQFIISQAVAATTMVVIRITAMTIIRSSGQIMALQHLKALQKHIGMFAAALACRAYRECPKT
jgi:hypothetical protein